MEVCLSQFAKLVPEYYKKYQAGEYHQGYCDLMNRFPKKSRDSGALGLEDLLEILEWGKDQRPKGRLVQDNTRAGVTEKTRDAYSSVDTEGAYRALSSLSHWGLTYASKTMMFMDPEKYVALDSNIRRGLKQLLGPISDGRGRYARNSQVRGYQKFLQVCRDLQAEVKAPPPDHSPHYPNFPRDPKGQWLLAEIQQAIFQFTKERNDIVPCDSLGAKV